MNKCDRCGAAMNRYTRHYCPSPEEIAERTAAIRSGWSEREHELRMPHAKREPVVMCLVPYVDVVAQQSVGRGHLGDE